LSKFDNAGPRQMTRQRQDSAVQIADTKYVQCTQTKVIDDDVAAGFPLLR
jgi:hypothetical protein